MPLQRGANQARKFRCAQLLHRYIQREPWRRDAQIAPQRQLMTGTLEGPGADVDDQAALLRRGDEVLRQPHTVARILPAQKALQSHQLAAAQRVLWLVVEREFT